MARKVKYLSNKNLLEQIKLSKEQNKMTDELVKMVMLLVHRYASKANFANYTFREDMEAEALANISTNWFKFDAAKSDNPFSYYTQIAHNSFLRVINSERKVSEIKDAVAEDIGRETSWRHKEQQAGDVQKRLKF